jgi:hypothetical protein
MNFSVSISESPFYEGAWKHGIRPFAVRCWNELSRKSVLNAADARMGRQKIGRVSLFRNAVFRFLRQIRAGFGDGPLETSHK